MARSADGGRWVDLSEETRSTNFHAYIGSIAEARYVMRKVTRILDETARTHGLEPLQHQALVQIYGTASGSVAIHELASRLDIVPAFASRLVKQLEERSLIERALLAADKRVTLITIAESGVALLRKVDEEVHHQMAYFQRGLDERQRVAALAIFAFYVGEPTESAIARAIRGAAG